jgi:HEPN domain-containing protein
MGKSGYVTETSEELFDKAEKDIMNIDIMNKDMVYPPDRKYDLICFHATQAVEKFLKGYIIKNGRQVEKLHNLEFLLTEAMNIDATFGTIRPQCMLLNKYSSDIKYTNRNPVTKSTMAEIVKSLQTVCNFPPIKSLRDLASNANKYEIIAAITTHEKIKSTRIKKKSENLDYDRER